LTDPASPDEISDIEGHYAGFATRTAAFAIDLLAIVAIFSVSGRIVEYLVNALSGDTFTFAQVPVLSDVALAIWAFAYCAYPLAMSGRTLGMAVLGVRVVREDGADVDTRHAALRVLAFPLSFIILGIGLLMILVERDRRALHDHIAHTAVVYAWESGPEPTRFLQKHRSG
jgi:uncharacterized RDD family membrane protein YckC